MQQGEVTFASTGLTATISTKLRTVHQVILQPNIAYANTDLVRGEKDPTITSGAITVNRAAGTTSDLSCNYILIGEF